MSSDDLSQYERHLRDRIEAAATGSRLVVEQMGQRTMQMKRGADASVTALGVIQEAMGDLGPGAVPSDLYLDALRDVAMTREEAEAVLRGLARYLVNGQGLSTVEVAKAAGVAQSTVSRWTSTTGTGRETR